MDDIQRGQVNRSAAEIYDEFYLPALFKQWVGVVLAVAGIGSGDKVLDVACGTGVLAMAAAERVAPDGSVVGLDINKGMLTIAQSKNSAIEWKHGQAEHLPFPDNHFDRVVSQFGLMFFDDRSAAILEMRRVLKPGGRLAVSVWDSLDNTPGYAAVTSVLQRLFGDQAANALRVPFRLGDAQILHSLFADSGLSGLEVRTQPGTAVFPSLETWIYTDVRGWTLAEMIEEAQFDLLLAEAESELKRFVSEDGLVTFPAPALIISGYKA